MSTMSTRSVVSIAGAVLLFASAFGATVLLRRAPASRTVALLPDEAAFAEDTHQLQAAWQALPPRQGHGPNLVFIVLDTLRADHLELYGYAQVTMPHLTARAGRGEVYENAQSPSPWTLPAHASMFTGQLPLAHGAHAERLKERSQRGASKGVNPVNRASINRPLPGSAQTLAEALQAAGWRTLGIAANLAFLQRHFNLAQGFDLWLCEQLDDTASNAPYVRGDRITSLGLQAADLYLAERGQAPLFLFLNYMDAHGPYTPWQGLVEDEDLLLPTKGQGANRQRLMARVLAGRQALPERQRRAWIAAYDAELRLLDRELERLLSGLEARGLLENTYVVVTSDHGEYFGEHGLLAHSKDVYQPVLHVPLLLWGPTVVAGRVATPISTMSLYQRLLQWAGLGVEPAPQAPAFLVSELYGSLMSARSDAATQQRFQRQRRAFRVGERKIILGDDGSFEAYDLNSDPDETHDLAAEGWAGALRLQAEAWLGGQASPPQDADEPQAKVLDEDALQRLEALGYLD